MASVRQVVTTISEVTGVPRQTVNNVARRLGEAGMLPRGPRGRHAPEFEARHVVRVLLGTMVLATDALNTPAGKVPAAVATIQALERRPDASDEKTNVFKKDDKKRASMFWSNYPFVDVVAKFLVAYAPKSTDKVIDLGPSPKSTPERRASFNSCC